MTNVPDDRFVLHPSHVVDGDDVKVACCCDEEIGFCNHIFERCNFVALHCCLERTDRVDLSDHHPAALAT